MPDQNRTVSSARNVLTGVMGQVFAFVMSFVGRLVFVHTLGQEYLGISGWFSNILSILSISELGVGTAIVVSLYAPLASGDQDRIRATMKLMRRAYFYVGLAIAGLGLMLLPFLPSLVKEKTDLVNLNVVYLLFLSQSVFSYLFLSYKGAVFTADQKQYRINLIQCLTSAVTTALQILVLVLWRNYYTYVAILVGMTIVKNLLVARRVDKAYPYLREKTDAELPKDQKKSIFKNLFGLSLYRLSGTVLNATDNLVLGKFIGFAIIGLYSNYLLVLTAVTTVLTLVFQSFTASVGHLNVTEDSERKAFIFRCLNLLDGWLYGFCAVCIFLLIDPFVRLFFGAEWVFEDPRVVPIIALNFLTSGLLENVIMHKDACGLFWQGRFRPVFSAGLNVGLSIWLVHPMGIAGVLLATILSRLLTTWWFDPWMVHHYALKTSCKGYFLQTTGVLALAAVMGAGLKALFSLWFSQVTVGSFLGMIAVAAVVPNGVFYLVFHRQPEFAYLKGAALSLLRGRQKRKDDGV